MSHRITHRHIYTERERERERDTANRLTHATVVGVSNDGRGPTNTSLLIIETLITSAFI